MVHFKRKLQLNKNNIHQFIFCHNKIYHGTSPTKQLFVRPIRDDVREDDLIEFFSTAAPVVEVRLMQGYAFVSFQTEDEADAALKKMDGQELNGEQLQVEFAKPKKRFIE